MPTYTTPDPIDLAITVQVGSLEIAASDRADTIVTVAPTNPSKAVDRRGAEETTVEFDGSRLTVTGPRPRASIIGPTESIDVRVELPSGSRFTAQIALGPVRTTGVLGATRVKSSTGVVHLDTVGDLWLRTGHGGATIGRADGAVEVTADHGQLRIGTITGDAQLKASHGSISIGESGGDVDAKLSYGELDIERALASVSAKTSYGAIRLGEISAGSIELDSGFGEIDLGVRAGVAAWLDISSSQGRVRNELDHDTAPDPAEQSVAVRARTRFGDIRISRTHREVTA